MTKEQWQYTKSLQRSKPAVEYVLQLPRDPNGRATRKCEQYIEARHYRLVQAQRDAREQRSAKESQRQAAKRAKARLRKAVERANESRTVTAEAKAA